MNSTMNFLYSWNQLHPKHLEKYICKHRSILIMIRLNRILDIMNLCSLWLLVSLRQESMFNFKLGILSFFIMHIFHSNWTRISVLVSCKWKLCLNLNESGFAGWIISSGWTDYIMLRSSQTRALTLQNILYVNNFSLVVV